MYVHYRTGLPVILVSLFYNLDFPVIYKALTICCSQSTTDCDWIVKGQQITLLSSNWHGTSKGIKVSLAHNAAPSSMNFNSAIQRITEGY